MFGWLKKIGDLASHRVYEKKETALFNFRYTKISMDGKDIGADALDEGLLQQISQQSGLSLQEVREMILGGEGVSTMRDFEEFVRDGGTIVRTETDEQTASVGPIRRVECAGCHRTVVARKNFCMYCGAILPEEQRVSQRGTSTEKAVETNQRSNDVDAKFLKTDVTKTEGREEDEDRDSYFQRLRRM